MNEQGIGSRRGVSREVKDAAAVSPSAAFGDPAVRDRLRAALERELAAVRATGDRAACERLAQALQSDMAKP